MRDRAQGDDSKHDLHYSTSWINLPNIAKTLQLTTFSSLFTVLQNKIELDISCESSTDRYFT